MPSRRERLLDSHLSQLETTEQRAARQVAAAYAQARRELIATLVGGWNGTGVDTPDQAAARLRQLALLDQIDARVAQLERETGLILRGLLNVAAEQGVEQIRREMALLPPSLRPENTLMFATINERMVERYAPAALDGLRAGTTDLGITLRRELQTGLLQGESFPNLVNRLMRNTPEGEGTAVFPRARTSAELATRRAVITAENAAKVAAIGEVATQEPLVRKQAIAVIGKGTTDCCLRVHGQIRRNDEPFELVGEPRFADRMMAPAFHWRCRTAVAMYHPAFEESMPTAKLEQDAKSELKRRRDEKAERSRSADERAAARAARAEREAAERAARDAEREALFDVLDEEAEAVAEAQQGLPYTASEEDLKVAEEAVDAGIRMHVLRRGGEFDEVARVADETFRKLVLENEIAIQFKSQHVDSLLTDGRFKTQFETGSSGGDFNPRIRAEAEQRGLGIPEDIDPAERPIYGFIDMGKMSRFNVAQYGDLTFIAKPGVRQRSTVTADDSLGNFRDGLVAGTPADDPGKVGWDRQVTPLNAYSKSGDLTDITNSFAYLEVQMQGGVRLDDMRAVIDTKGVLSAAQRKALQDRGIEIWEK